VVSLQAPGANVIDQALQTVGLARRIGLSSHSFAGNLAALHGSDLIASLPARMCQNLDHGLRSFDLPLAVPRYDYGLVWHDRTHASAPHRWLRNAVARALVAAQP
jgi:DNA-binding transcriptional LysR family regulator